MFKLNLYTPNYLINSVRVALAAKKPDVAAKNNFTLSLVYSYRLGNITPMNSISVIITITNTDNFLSNLLCIDIFIAPRFSTHALSTTLIPRFRLIFSCDKNLISSSSKVIGSSLLICCFFPISLFLQYQNW